LRASGGSGVESNFAAAESVFRRSGDLQALPCRRRYKTPGKD
jgi:hypothetical protein